MYLGIKPLYFILVSFAIIKFATPDKGIAAFNVQLFCVLSCSYVRSTTRT